MPLLWRGGPLLCKEALLFEPTALALVITETASCTPTCQSSHIRITISCLVSVLSNVVFTTLFEFEMLLPKLTQPSHPYCPLSGYFMVLLSDVVFITLFESEMLLTTLTQPSHPYCPSSGYFMPVLSDVVFTTLFGVEMLLKIIAFTGKAYIAIITNQVRLTCSMQ